MRKKGGRDNKALWEGISTKAALVFTDDYQTIFCHIDKNGSVTRKALSVESINQAFADAPVTSGWLPAEAWHWGRGMTGEWIVLLFPAGIHSLYLTNDFADEFPKGGVIEVKVPLPPLVFGGIGSRYYVWALGKGELSPQAMAFHAPMPNVDADGKICFGKNELPIAASSTIVEAWQVFLATPFNDHIVQGKSQEHHDDVRQQLLAVSRGRARRYPLHDLSPTGRTIQLLIEKAFCGIGSHLEARI